MRVDVGPLGGKLLEFAAVMSILTFLNLSFRVLTISFLYLPVFLFFFPTSR